MKTIIAGSRTITDYNLLKHVISMYQYPITEIVCGMAKGVDSLGYKYGKEFSIAVSEFPADWNKYGKKAGYIRNEQMAQYADALILIWDGKSPGSKNMLKNGNKYGLKIFEYNINNPIDSTNNLEQFYDQ